MLLCDSFQTIQDRIIEQNIFPSFLDRHSDSDTEENSHSRAVSSSSHVYGIAHGANPALPLNLSSGNSSGLSIFTTRTSSSFSSSGPLVSSLVTVNRSYLSLSGGGARQQQLHHGCRAAVPTAVCVQAANRSASSRRNDDSVKETKKAPASIIPPPPALM